MSDENRLPQQILRIDFSTFENQKLTHKYDYAMSLEEKELRRDGYYLLPPYATQARNRISEDHQIITGMKARVCSSCGKILFHTRDDPVEYVCCERSKDNFVETSAYDALTLTSPKNRICFGTHFFPCFTYFPKKCYRCPFLETCKQGKLATKIYGLNP